MKAEGVSLTPVKPMLTFRKSPASFVLLAIIGFVIVAVILFVIRLVAVVAVFDEDRQATVITEENREKIIAALNRYYADHGDYPASLNNLVPAYLPGIPEQLLTPNTGWQYKTTSIGFAFGYLEWPDKLGMSWICSYSSDDPEWHCASGNFEPFGEIPTPYP